MHIFLFDQDGFDLPLSTDAINTEIDCLANETGINPTQNKKLYALAVDNQECIVGALFVDYYSDNFDFDIMVQPEVQGQGVGKKMLDESLALFYSLKSTSANITSSIRVLHPIVRAHLYRNGFVPTHFDDQLEDVIMTHQNSATNTDERLKTFTSLMTPSINFFQREVKPLLLLSEVTMGKLDSAFKKAAGGEPLDDKEARLLATFAMNQPRNRWERESLLTAVRDNSSLDVKLPVNHQSKFDGFIEQKHQKAQEIFQKTQADFSLSDEVLETTIKQAYTILGNGSVPVFSADEIAAPVSLLTELSRHLDIDAVLDNLTQTLHVDIVMQQRQALERAISRSESPETPEEPVRSPSMKP